MIQGAHTMFYSSQPDELRAFFRDRLGFSFTDVGDGWLIFDLPEADLGCHPAESEQGAVPSGTPYLSFYCDDLETTINELKAKGVQFTGEVTDKGYGLAIRFKVPGDFTIELYQPSYSK